MDSPKDFFGGVVENMDSPTLSTEEKEERVRSNKKVKCPTHGQGTGPDSSSFKINSLGIFQVHTLRLFVLTIAWRMKTDPMRRLKTFVKV